MSELPRGWTWERLGDLGQEITGSTVPEPSTEYELYSVPAFPTRKPEVLHGSQIGSNKRSVNPGDVLLCKINPRINRVWMVGERTSDRPQLASTEYFVLRVSNGTVARYLQWYLTGPQFRSWIELAVEGATGSHTRAKSGRILEQLVPVPPEPEQRRILAIVDEQLSRLEGARSSLQAASRRSAALRASVLAELINEAWPRRRIGDLFEVFVGTTPSRSNPAFWNGGIAWVASGEVAFCRIRRTRETISPQATTADRVHPPGTVLLAMIGEGRTRGQAAILDVAAAHNQNSAAIRIDVSVALPEWLFYVFMQRYAETRRVGSGNNQPALNKSRVQEIPIPLPSLEDQRRMIKQVEQQLSLIEALVLTVDRALRRLQRLRVAILERAFSGRLVPQDPNDEPASELLKRIKGDRGEPSETGRGRRRRVSTVKS